MSIKRCQKVDVLKNLRSTLFCAIWRVQPPQDDDAAYLLAPVPAVRTGSLVGYARVSTKGRCSTGRSTHSPKQGASASSPTRSPARTPNARNCGRPSTTCARATPSSSRRWTGIVTSIAKLLGVSRNTIYNYVPEPKGGRLALAEATNTPELPQPARSED